MASFRLTPAAIDDLDAIWLYTSTRTIHPVLTRWKMNSGRPVHCSRKDRLRVMCVAI
jgi:hypothetical protein